MRILATMLIAGLCVLTACSRDKEERAYVCTTDLPPLRVMLVGADGKNLIFGPDKKMPADSVRIVSAFSSYIGLPQIDSPYVNLGHLGVRKGNFIISVSPPGGAAKTFLMNVTMVAPCYKVAESITVDNGGTGCTDCDRNPVIKLPF